jgi:nucleoside 2-deoxyribosyltransferase
MDLPVGKSAPFLYSGNMLRLTELVYLAAPFVKPEERAFNDRLAQLARAYNFPMFLPQEALEEIEAGDSPFLDISTDDKRPDEILTEVCMEALNRANLVISVFYGDEFDTLTAFEVGYALGRRTNVVAVQNRLEPGLSREGCINRLSTPQVCSRVVIAPHEDDHFPDRLIPILNRYFVPHKL